VAFEIAKLLEHDRQETPILAIIDQPPHIRERMRQASWDRTLIVISRFLDVFQNPEKENACITEIQKSVHGFGDGGEAEKAQLAEMLLTFASAQRLQELGLDTIRLQRWTDLAYNSHKIAQRYEPSGSVRAMEVLYGHPIEEVANSREQWLETKLSRWADFTQNLKFHQLEGSHYTLLSPQNAPAVAAILKSRLKAHAL
jgi:thioesterase domain-containing protein